MSDLAEKLQAWRDQGSLRYLAHHLHVTTKQAARYWDYGWIAGRYRTPKGHRRIRYTDDTVRFVALAVKQMKANNIAIRYHCPELVYGDVLISFEGCTNMQHVYLRARKAGLSRQNALNVATSRGRAQSDMDLEWELLHALQGTSWKEVTERTRVLAWLPLEYLEEARDADDFRARSEAVRSDLEARPGWERVREILIPLLDQPDRETFWVAYLNASKLDRRIMEYDEHEYGPIAERAKTQPQKTRLEIAALSLHQSGQPPTATALARALGVSRPALYRMFKVNEIHAALNPLRNDTRAINESANDNLAKRKKSNRIGDAGSVRR